MVFKITVHLDDGGDFSEVLNVQSCSWIAASPLSTSFHGLKIWTSKIARISDLCTSFSISLLHSAASTSCWWKWCNEMLLNFLQEQFLTLWSCNLHQQREYFTSHSVIH